MKKPRNILLFVTDDHAHWALGCMGNREIQTPNLDYLAQTGVKMVNAFTPTPVCSPARACLFTGRLASQHGIHDYLASGDRAINSINWLAHEVTLGQLLKSAGYQTGLVGKWHLGQDEHPQPGYDTWFTLGRDYPVWHQGPHRYGMAGEMKSMPGYVTQVITDQASQFLRQCTSSAPFFLTVGYYATHSPWEAHPERLVSRYRDCTFADIPEDIAYPFGRQNLESTNETRDNPRETLAQYYAAVTEIDEAIGRLIDVLESLDCLQDTLIIYTSDHGLNCGHHGIWGKGNGTLPLNMVEESIRVPLIFWQGSQLYGRLQRHEFVDHLDTFQTILAAAQVKAPREVVYPGKSYWPFLVNQHIADWRTTQFGEYGNVRLARTEKYKLIRRYPDGPCEFFDLETDPRETVNRFQDPSYQPLVAQLTDQLDAYFADHEEPEKSGLRVIERPRHNFSEAWRA
ncbi:MAG: sulfatase-like hydrolase/transferase [Chloroflexota bacterium]